MSNLVEITYQKTGKYPQISINGEAISRYMSLSDHIYDDIFKWADKFYEIIDSELSEGYRVVVTGHPYHGIVLKSMLHKSEYCEKLAFNECERRISTANKYAYVKHMENVGSDKQNDRDCIAFQCANVSEFDDLDIANVRFTSDFSEYYIAMDSDEALNCNSKYCIVVCDKNIVENKKNQTILYITRENLPVLIDYFCTYHLHLAKIEEIFAKFSNSITDEEVKAEFDAYYNEEYRIYMPKPIPKELKCGDKVNVEYKVFPECFPKEGVVLKLSDTSVLEHQNGQLIAKEPGTCVVRICDSLGKEYMKTVVEVSKSNYVTNISIMLPTTTVNIGETLSFRCIATPTNAEDINQLSYSVNDERVAVISAPNELYAISDGRVCVTVSTPRVKKKFYITVLPKAYDIVVSSEKITLPFAAEATIYGAVIPENVTPMPELTWSVSNKNVIDIKSSDSGKCCIESKNTGRAVLVCSIRDTDVRKNIEVIVPKVKGCYVATSVYGSYDCSEVWVLRRFRDQYLSNRWLGRLFIKVYYAVSPTVVTIFGKYKWFNHFWRNVLDRMVEKLQRKGYEDTPYIDD